MSDMRISIHSPLRGPLRAASVGARIQQNVADCEKPPLAGHPDGHRPVHRARLSCSGHFFSELLQSEQAALELLPKLLQVLLEEPLLLLVEAGLTPDG
jgi:hypothetical protein